MVSHVQVLMLVLLFLAGLVLIGAGLWMILTREYQDTMKTLAGQSGRISSKSLSDAAVQPMLQGASQLIESITKMVQTALGTGAFLCLLGSTLCGLSLWLSTLM
ncbi:MAG: hypothetical protein MUD01_01580 [Chloroflexaceae bacterium]|jgi:hypothetical protein|nr:hypothetical protein [Chloroflexaceae bacterium]